MVMSCQDPSLVGVDFVDEDPLSITYYDTLSIQLSTVKLDSLVTSNSSRLLVGRVEDDRIGCITGNAFFQVGRDSLFTFPDEEKAVYDSMSFEMNFDGYSYGDTSNYQTYYLYALLEEMKLGDDGYLYNTSRIEVREDSTYLMGKIRFIPRVRKGQAEYLSITDDLGIPLFELLKERDDMVTDNDEFREYIKGYALVPDSLNTCIIGLDNESSFKLYYRQDGEQVVQTFPIASNIRFTQINVNYEDSVFESLSTQKDMLPSNILEHIAYIQGGLGLGIRMEIPYLDYVRELNKNNMVTDAELIFKPVRNSYTGWSPLSTSLTAYYVDKYNNIVDELSITPVLYVDVEYGEETYYSIDIHAFLEEQLNMLENDGSALLFTLPESNNASTVNRLCIGDEFHTDKSYLKLIIMNINESF